MHNNIRLSRISHPRATLLGFILLFAVFMLFGLWAQVFHPEWMQVSAQPTTTTILTDTQLGAASQRWLQDILVYLR